MVHFFPDILRENDYTHIVQFAERTSIPPGSLQKITSQETSNDKIS